jgi:single-strand DNA-binding protein
MAAGDIPLTIVGNLTADPELRFTPSGQAVANFTVASTSRFLDKQTQEWKDGDTVFIRCSVWRQYAENVAESLTKGTRVIVTGRLKVRQYETREGGKGTSVECDVDEVGPALRHATAKVNRVARSDGFGGAQPGGGFGGGGQQGGGYGGGRADDPWASQAGGSGGGGFPDDAPPF